MKVYFNIILIMLILSCNNKQEKKVINDSPDSTSKNIVHKKSMKGFDLYAWEKAGKMFFTLLPGTNRKKTPEDIYNMKNAVEGESSIEYKIDQIDSGEYIFLNPIHIDTSDLKPLIGFMKRKNLNVTIIPEK